MLVSAGFQSNPPRHTFRRAAGFPHWTCEFLLRGAVVITSRDLSVEVRGPYLTLVRPGVGYGVARARPSGVWVEGWAIFDPPDRWTELAPLTQLMPGIGGMPIDSTCHGRRMLRNFLDTAAAARRLPERRTEVIENGIHRMLLLAEIDAGRRGGVPAPHDPRIRKVVRLIDEDPAARRSVGDLAALAHLSPSRFAHVFRDEVGIGPKRYLEGRRLARAGDLLLTTDRTVEQIARDVGFESPEHFSTRFRAVIGVPPREYRKRPTRVDPPSGDVG